MSTNPTNISILIPCYNQSEYIGWVIQAALNQTKPALEVIVVDDASTDDSATVISQYPVKLVQHDRNRRLATTRNTALEAARGSIVLFVDGDAIPDQHLVEVIHREFSNADDSLIGVGGRGIETNVTSIYDRWRARHTSQDYGVKPRRSVPFLFGLCCAYRRSFLLDVGGFDPFYSQNCGEDLDLGYRINRKGHRLSYTPDALVYHMHSDSEEILKLVNYNWAYWAYMAKLRNNLPTWKLYVGYLRSTITACLVDLVQEKDINMARLSLLILGVKLQGLKNAASRVNEPGFILHRSDSYASEE